MSCSCAPPCFNRTVDTPPSTSPGIDRVKQKKLEGEKHVRNLIITTIALLAVAIFLMALSRVGTGLGHLPATRMTGFSFIYHFAALHVFFIGAGVGVVTICFSLYTLYVTRKNTMDTDAEAYAAAARATEQQLAAAIIVDGPPPPADT